MTRTPLFAALRCAELGCLQSRLWILIVKQNAFCYLKRYVLTALLSVERLVVRCAEEAVRPAARLEPLRDVRTNDLGDNG